MINHFAENLLYYRNKKNISQTHLARRVHTTHQTISHYEHGTRYCDLDSLIRIADVLKISIDDLIRNPHP